MKRRTKRRKQVLAALALLLMVAPAVVPAQETVGVVDGHTTYVDLDSLDPCLAAIVGEVRFRVMWFDDSILHERADGGDGETFLYATQHGAPDPTAHTNFQSVEELSEETDDDSRILATAGYYNFTDPNGYTWNVTEAYYEHRPDGDADETGDAGDGNSNVSYEAGTNRYYVWIVEVGPRIEDFHPGTSNHETYNFVNMVNSCKFTRHANNGSVNHTGDESGHLSSDGNHTHQTWKVDLYVGSEPSTIPLGVEPPHWLEGYQRTGTEGDQNVE